MAQVERLVSNISGTYISSCCGFLSPQHVSVNCRYGALAVPMHHCRAFHRVKVAAVFAPLAFWSSAVAADPCGARVAGHPPGATLVGQVRYVGDADSLCVGESPKPSTWFEIRLADFFGPELNAPGGRSARSALIHLALGKATVCVVQRGNNGRTTSYDRLIAVCRIDGISIGDLLREHGVNEGGRGYNPSLPALEGAHHRE